MAANGGKVFKDPSGNKLASPIKKDDVAQTISWLEGITGLNLSSNTLGSVGKKAISGDIDLLVDERTTAKDILIRSLARWSKDHGHDPSDMIKKSGISVHFLTPICGKEQNGFVQTDFMFHDDPRWMKFSMHSAGDDSSFTGGERNMLMSSIAKARGLKYSWQRGLLNRETEEPITKDPDLIAKALLDPMRSTPTDLRSVESIRDVALADSKLIYMLKSMVTRLKDGSGKKPAEAKENLKEVDRIVKVFGEILTIN